MENPIDINIKNQQPQAVKSGLERGTAEIPRNSARIVSEKNLTVVAQFENPNVKVSSINQKHLQAIRTKLGDFNYDKQDFEQTLDTREVRNVVIMENGARYTGEWLVG